MIAYILKFTNADNGLAVLDGIGLAKLDEDEVPYLSPPDKCGFMAVELVVQRAEYDDFDPENLLETKPRITLDGYWLAFMTPKRHLTIEALPHCLRGVDLAAAKGDDQTHEIYAKPDMDLSGILLIEPLPQGVKTVHLLG